MAESVVSCPGTCTLVIVHELSLPPLQLSAEDGVQISLAILSVWAVGFGVRMVVKVLRSGDSPGQVEE